MKSCLIFKDNKFESSPFFGHCQDLILFRLQTFLLNAFILRYISKDVLGIINVRLFLLYSTILFLSKESFRNACLSYTREHRWPQVINLLWLMVPTSVISSFILGAIWLYVLEQPNEEYVQQYSDGVVIIALCCILEMVAEPLYIVARIFLFNKLRVVIECFSVASRCICLALTVYANPEVAITGYAVGQVLHSFIWVAGIYLYFAYYLKRNAIKVQHLSKNEAEHGFPFRQLRDFFPRYLHGQPCFSRDQLSLTWSFFKQGLLKQILTEGERYIMTLFSVLTFAEQGIFDSVSNLGSLAARFIFRPVEDSSYQFFAAMVKRGLPLSKQKKEDVKLVANVLENLLRVMILLGLVVVTFGYAYSHLLLNFYGGTLLSCGIGPTLLKCHCVYVLLLAINGVSECYVFSTMSKQDIERYNIVMVFFSIGFLLLSWYLTTLIGSVGFILANCANMVARIIYSCSYIHVVYKKTEFYPLNGLVPNLFVLLTLCASFILTSASEIHFFSTSENSFTIVHIGIGGVCCLFVLLVVIVKDKALYEFVRRSVSAKKLL